MIVSSGIPDSYLNDSTKSSLSPRFVDSPAVVTVWVTFQALHPRCGPCTTIEDSSRAPYDLRATSPRFARAMIYVVQTSPVIEVQGTITLGELTRFQYFHTLHRTWLLAVGAAVTLVFVVPLAVLAAASEDLRWRQVLTNAIPFILLLLFWVFALGVLPYWNARKLYASQIFLREPIFYKFSSENFCGSGPSASWSIAWNVLKTVRETKSLFLLYHHRNIAVIVPKRFFGSEAEMEIWRQLVLTSAAPSQIKPIGIVGALC